MRCVMPRAEHGQREEEALSRHGQGARPDHAPHNAHRLPDVPDVRPKTSERRLARGPIFLEQIADRRLPVAGPQETLQERLRPTRRTRFSSLHARTLSGHTMPSHNVSIATLARFNARTPAPVGTK